MIALVPAQERLDVAVPAWRDTQQSEVEPEDEQEHHARRLAWAGVTWDPPIDDTPAGGVLPLVLYAGPNYTRWELSSTEEVPVGGRVVLVRGSMYPVSAIAGMCLNDAYTPYDKLPPLDGTVDIPIGPDERSAVWTDGLTFTQGGNFALCWSRGGTFGIGDGEIIPYSTNKYDVWGAYDSCGDTMYPLCLANRRFFCWAPHAANSHYDQIGTNCDVYVQGANSPLRFTRLTWMTGDRCGFEVGDAFHQWNLTVLEGIGNLVLPAWARYVDPVSMISLGRTRYDLKTGFQYLLCFCPAYDSSDNGVCGEPPDFAQHIGIIEGLIVSYKDTFGQIVSQVLAMTHFTIVVDCGGGPWCGTNETARLKVVDRDWGHLNDTEADVQHWEPGAACRVVNETDAWYSPANCLDNTTGLKTLGDCILSGGADPNQQVFGLDATRFLSKTENTQPVAQLFDVCFSHNPVSADEDASFDAASDEAMQQRTQIFMKVGQLIVEPLLLVGPWNFSVNVTGEVRVAPPGARNSNMHGPLLPGAETILANATGPFLKIVYAYENFTEGVIFDQSSCAEALPSEKDLEGLVCDVPSQCYPRVLKQGEELVLQGLIKPMRAGKFAICYCEAWEQDPDSCAVPEHWALVSRFWGAGPGEAAYFIIYTGLVQYIEILGYGFSDVNTMRILRVGFPCGEGSYHATDATLLVCSSTAKCHPHFVGGLPNETVADIQGGLWRHSSVTPPSYVTRIWSVGDGRSSYVSFAEAPLLEVGDFWFIEPSIEPLVDNWVRKRDLLRILQGGDLGHEVVEVLAGGYIVRIDLHLDPIPDISFVNVGWYRNSRLRAPMLKPTIEAEGLNVCWGPGGGEYSSLAATIDFVTPNYLYRVTLGLTTTAVGATAPIIITFWTNLVQVYTFPEGPTQLRLTFKNTSIILPAGSDINGMPLGILAAANTAPEASQAACGRLFLEMYTDGGFPVPRGCYVDMNRFASGGEVQSIYIMFEPMNGLRGQQKYTLVLNARLGKTMSLSDYDALEEKLLEVAVMDDYDVRRNGILEVGFANPDKGIEVAAQPGTTDVQFFKPGGVTLVSLVDGTGSVQNTETATATSVTTFTTATESTTTVTSTFSTTFATLTQTNATLTLAPMNTTTTELNATFTTRTVTSTLTSSGTSTSSNATSTVTTLTSASASTTQSVTSQTTVSVTHPVFRELLHITDSSFGLSFQLRGDPIGQITGGSIIRLYIFPLTAWNFDFTQDCEVRCVPQLDHDCAGQMKCKFEASQSVCEDDRPLGSDYWVDIRGRECKWYEEDTSRCEAESIESLPISGMNVLDACCGCNGGIRGDINLVKITLPISMDPAFGSEVIHTIHFWGGRVTERAFFATRIGAQVTDKLDTKPDYQASAGRYILKTTFPGISPVASLVAVDGWGNSNPFKNSFDPNDFYLKLHVPITLRRAPGDGARASFEVALPNGFRCSSVDVGNSELPVLPAVPPTGHGMLPPSWSWGGGNASAPGTQLQSGTWLFSGNRCIFDFGPDMVLWYGQTVFLHIFAFNPVSQLPKLDPTNVWSVTFSSTGGFGQPPDYSEPSCTPYDPPTCELTGEDYYFNPLGIPERTRSFVQLYPDADFLEETVGPLNLGAVSDDYTVSFSVLGVIVSPLMQPTYFHPSASNTMRIWFVPDSGVKRPGLLGVQAPSGFDFGFPYCYARDLPEEYYKRRGTPRVTRPLVYRVENIGTCRPNRPPKWAPYGVYMRIQVDGALVPGMLYGFEVDVVNAQSYDPSTHNGEGWSFKVDIADQYGDGHDGTETTGTFSVGGTKAWSLYRAPTLVPVVVSISAARPYVFTGLKTVIQINPMVLSINVTGPLRVMAPEGYIWSWDRDAEFIYDGLPRQTLPMPGKVPDLPNSSVSLNELRWKGKKYIAGETYAFQTFIKVPAAPPTTSSNSFYFEFGYDENSGRGVTGGVAAEAAGPEIMTLGTVKVEMSSTNAGASAALWIWVETVSEIDGRGALEIQVPYGDMTFATDAEKHCIVSAVDVWGSLPLPDDIECRRVLFLRTEDEHFRIQLRTNRSTFVPGRYVLEFPVTNPPLPYFNSPSASSDCGYVHCFSFFSMAVASGVAEVFIGPVHWTSTDRPDPYDAEDQLDYWATVPALSITRDMLEGEIAAATLLERIFMGRNDGGERRSALVMAFMLGSYNPVDGDRIIVRAPVGFVFDYSCSFWVQESEVYPPPLEGIPRPYVTAGGVSHNASDWPDTVEAVRCSGDGNMATVTLAGTGLRPTNLYLFRISTRSNPLVTPERNTWSITIGEESKEFLGFEIWTFPNAFLTPTMFAWTTKDNPQPTAVKIQFQVANALVVTQVQGLSLRPKLRMTMPPLFEFVIAGDDQDQNGGECSATLLQKGSCRTCNEPFQSDTVLCERSPNMKNRAEVPLIGAELLPGNTYELWLEVFNPHIESPQDIPPPSWLFESFLGETSPPAEAPYGFPVDTARIAGFRVTGRANLVIAKVDERNASALVPPVEFRFEVPDTIEPGDAIRINAPPGYDMSKELLVASEVVPCQSFQYLPAILSEMAGVSFGIRRRRAAWKFDASILVMTSQGELFSSPFNGLSFEELPDWAAPLVASRQEIQAFQWKLYFDNYINISNTTQTTSTETTTTRTTTTETSTATGNVTNMTNQTNVSVMNTTEVAEAEWYNASFFYEPLWYALQDICVGPGCKDNDVWSGPAGLSFDWSDLPNGTILTFFADAPNVLFPHIADAPGSPHLCLRADWVVTAYNATKPLCYEICNGTNSSNATSSESLTNATSDCNETDSVAVCNETNATNMSETAAMDVSVTSTSTLSNASSNGTQDEAQCITVCPPKPTMEECNRFCGDTGLPTAMEVAENCSEKLPLEACRDLPDNWIDTFDHTCAEYGDEQWCTLSGGYGARWDESWGTFDNHSNMGASATEACCACGGGMQAYVSVSGPHCPQGYRDILAAQECDHARQLLGVNGWHESLGEGERFLPHCWIDDAGVANFKLTGNREYDAMDSKVMCAQITPEYVNCTVTNTPPPCAEGCVPYPLGMTEGLCSAVGGDHPPNGLMLAYQIIHLENASAIVRVLFETDANLTEVLDLTPKPVEVDPSFEIYPLQAVPECYGDIMHIRVKAEDLHPDPSYLNGTIFRFQMAFRNPTSPGNDYVNYWKLNHFKKAGADVVSTAAFVGWETLSPLRWISTYILNEVLEPHRPAELHFEFVTVSPATECQITGIQPVGFDFTNAFVSSIGTGSITVGAGNINRRLSRRLLWDGWTSGITERSAEGPFMVFDVSFLLYEYVKFKVDGVLIPWSGGRTKWTIMTYFYDRLKDRAVECCAPGEPVDNPANLFFVPHRLTDMAGRFDNGYKQTPAIYPVASAMEGRFAELQRVMLTFSLPARHYRILTPEGFGIVVVLRVPQAYKIQEAEFEINRWETLSESGLLVSPKNTPVRSDVQFLSWEKVHLTLPLDNLELDDGSGGIYYQVVFEVMTPESYESQEADPKWVVELTTAWDIEEGEAATTLGAINSSLLVAEAVFKVIRASAPPSVDLTLSVEITAFGSLVVYRLELYAPGGFKFKSNCSVEQTPTFGSCVERFGLFKASYLSGAMIQAKDGGVSSSALPTTLRLRIRSPPFTPSPNTWFLRTYGGEEGSHTPTSWGMVENAFPILGMATTVSHSMVASTAAPVIFAFVPNYNIPWGGILHFAAPRMFRLSCPVQVLTQLGDVDGKCTQTDSYTLFGCYGLAKVGEGPALGLPECQPEHELVLRFEKKDDAPPTTRPHAVGAGTRVVLSTNAVIPAYTPYPHSENVFRFRLLNADRSAFDGKFNQQGGKMIRKPHIHKFKLWFERGGPGEMVSVVLDFEFGETYHRKDEVGAPLHIIHIEAPADFTMEVTRSSDVLCLNNNTNEVKPPVIDWKWTYARPQSLWFSLDVNQDLSGRFYYMFPVGLPANPPGTPAYNVWQIRFCDEKPDCVDTRAMVPLPGFGFDEDPGFELDKEAKQMLDTAKAAAARPRASPSMSLIVLALLSPFAPSFWQWCSDHT